MRSTQRVGYYKGMDTYYIKTHSYKAASGQAWWIWNFLNSNTPCPKSPLTDYYKRHYWM